jgi:hypothetical protein
MSQSFAGLLLLRHQLYRLKVSNIPECGVKEQEGNDATHN